MSVPECIGIILDGNRRWAKREGLPSLEGHRRGADRLIECVRWVRDREIKHLVVYAFSTENWNRTREEVAYLMDLAREFAERKLDALTKEGVRVRFIGKLDMLPDDLQRSIKRAEDAGATNTAITLWVCVSYGSRAEIGDESYNIHVNIPGDFNVSNAMAAAAVGREIGLTKDQIEDGIAALMGVEGRMSVVDEGQPFKVIVDFASTPDAFERLFTSLKPLIKGKLIAVFGSAGRRDESKRAVQGEIAGRFADCRR